MARGCDWCATCDDLTLTILALARFAMNSCAAGGMVLSAVARRYQEGMVFHAGSPDGSVNAASENGRWEAYITRVVLRGRSPAKASWKMPAFR